MYIASPLGFGFGVPPDRRLTFRPPNPRGAPGKLGPRLLRTRFQTHLQAFPLILPAPVAFRIRLPGTQPAMNPRRERLSAGHGTRATLPAAPPVAPAIAPTAGAFGATGLGAGPYTIMRSGSWAPYAQALSHIKSGVTGAGRLVHAATNPAYSQQNVPAGTYPDWV